MQRFLTKTVVTGGQGLFAGLFSDATQANQTLTSLARNQAAARDTTRREVGAELRPRRRPPCKVCASTRARGLLRGPYIQTELWVHYGSAAAVVTARSC
jgi:hypothetical protein